MPRLIREAPIQVIITGIDVTWYCGTAVHGYDGEGRRMKKVVGGETTFYFYGPMGLLCEFTTTNTGSVQAAATDRATYRTSDKLGSAILV